MTQYREFRERLRPATARAARVAASVALSAGAALSAVAVAACAGEGAPPVADTAPVTARDVAILPADSGRGAALADEPVPTPAIPPAPAATPPARPTPPPAPAKRPPAPRASGLPAAAPATPAAPAAGTGAGKPPAADSAVERSATLPAGTPLRFTATRRQCTNTLRTGDRLTATLAEAVPAGNGIELASGATGVFEVVEARTAQSANDETVLVLRLVAVQQGTRSYPVTATTQSAAITRVRSASRQEDLRKVAGGAVAGAIAGRILGGGTRGTVIGAAAGAAAGSAAAAATGNADSCLDAGAVVAVRLDLPLTVHPPVVP